MKNFDAVLEDILKAEGGFVDIPDDLGGPTKYGITIRTLAKWRGNTVTRDDILNLTIQEAKDIYRAFYLAPYKDHPDDMFPLLVDTAVNMGQGRADILWAQSKTAPDPKKEFLKRRILYYATIVRNRPKQAKFIVGWLTRALKFL